MPTGISFVLTRGDKTFFEFDRDGTFIRAFGDKLFTRSHGLRIDREGNLWATDVGGHVVVKMNRDGQALLTIGTRGEAGEWNEASGSRKLNQPNDVAIAANGDVFVVQGHTPGPTGDARVLKFSKDGTFIKSWGGKGTGPGQFQVAHGIAIRRQGPAVDCGSRESTHPGLPAGRNVRQRNQIQGAAVQPRHRQTVHLHGERLRGTARQTRSEW